MQVITTHLNADFDCLASMVAARKLYPSARLVFPGSTEKGVNEFLKQSALFPGFSRIKDIDLDVVSQLIIVDTHDPGRIGVFQSLLNNPNVEVHIYDHHPEEVADALAGAKCVIKKRGASATLLCEILEGKNISLTPEESTLMVLGIFQDTQSLFSVSTTPEDFSAAGKLVASGANMKTVARFVQPRLNSQQIEILNQLVSNIESHNINGVEIAMTTASEDFYVEDVSYVVSQVMALENLKALFALVRLDQGVYVIARSRCDEVNVAEVARHLGGGGHSCAASASVKNQTLVQVREKLFELLHASLQPLHRVSDIMHFPVQSATGDESLLSVEKTLTRFNLNTLPVLADNKPVGLITRQIVEKAIHHKMRDAKVKDFMISDFSVSTPDAYFKSIVPIIIEKKQKLVPVIDPVSKNLAGIVSRGDLLRVLHRDMVSSGFDTSRLFDGKRESMKNVKSLLKERLHKDVMALLDSISQIADREKVEVYVVGGFVRDLLLNIQNFDIDLVVEGDGIAFAETLAREFNGRTKSHDKFGTSVVLLKDRSRIDVATARMEYYSHPGALPKVERSSVKSDLFRRDFTINSMAVKLNGQGAFCLIDYFNGEKDLKDGSIRVLHNLSFIEDPCRIFRAIRFEQRFGFRVGRQTRAFMKSAIKNNLVNQLSGTRLMNELKLLMRESDPMKCIDRMRELSLLYLIVPGIAEGDSHRLVLKKIAGVLTWAKMVPMAKKPEVWFVYFHALFIAMKEAAFEKAMERLHIPMKIRNRMRLDRGHFVKAKDKFNDGRELKPSEVYDVLSELSIEAVILLLAVCSSDQVNKHAMLYFNQYCSLAKTELTGEDLIGMGMKPGPVFQDVLKTLRDARVNGQVTSRDEEVALVGSQFLK